MGIEPECQRGRKMGMIYGALRWLKEGLIFIRSRRKKPSKEAVERVDFCVGKR